MRALFHNEGFQILVGICVLVICFTIFATTAVRGQQVEYTERIVAAEEAGDHVTACTIINGDSAVCAK